MGAHHPHIERLTKQVANLASAIEHGIHGTQVYSVLDPGGTHNSGGSSFPHALKKLNQREFRLFISCLWLSNSRRLNFFFFFTNMSPTWNSHQVFPSRQMTERETHSLHTHEEGSQIGLAAS